MLNLFLRIVAVVACFILLIAAIGALLPRGYDVHASIWIDRPVDEVFPWVDQLENWQQWSMWNPQQLRDLAVRYEGPAAGPGAAQHWTDGRGSGTLTIVAADPPSRVAYTMTYGDFPQMQGEFQLEPDGRGTQVHWISRGKLPAGPFYGWAGLIFERSLTGEYNKSLERLKIVVERAPR